MIDFEVNIYGDDFSPKKFQEETGFIFSKCSEIGDRIAGKYVSQRGSAKILSQENEYLIDFLNRLKESKSYFSLENSKKYGIDFIILDIKSTSLKFNFSIKDIKTLAQLSFIHEIVIKEHKRTKKYAVYHQENEIYQRSIEFLKNRLKEARERKQLSYQNVAEFGFISAKQLENLENSEKIQKIDFFLVKELAKIYGFPLEFFYEEINYYQ